MIIDPVLTREKPRDLQGLKSNTGVLQGLAHMAYGFEVGFGLERIRSDQGTCVRIASMNVKSGHITPKIWLRPEIQKGTCPYNVTIEHELEHVENYHDHLVRFEGMIDRELAIMMRANAYYRVEIWIDGWIHPQNTGDFPIYADNVMSSVSHLPNALGYWFLKVCSASSVSNWRSGRDMISLSRF